MSTPLRRLSRIVRSRGSFKHTPYSEMAHTTNFVKTGEARGLYQSWIFKHFRSNECYATYFNSNYLVCPSSRVLSSDLKTLTHAQLLDFACATGSRRENKSLVTKVDAEISHRLPQIESVELILQLLDLLIQVRPTALQSTPIFRESISRIETLALRKRVSLPHLIQAMYYASLGKTGRVAQRVVKTLYRLIDHREIKELDVDDLGIFCNSLFRSSVPIQDKPVLELIVDRIASSDSYCIHNDATLISIIKVLRHATYNTELLYQRFETLMSSPSFPWHTKSLPYKVHMLAYFADGLYANTQFIELFIRQAILDVDERIRTNQRIRLKDLDRLLWSASNYMLESVKSLLSASEIPNYLENLCDDIFEKELSIVCNIFFWLWVCGHFHYTGVYRLLRCPDIFKVKGDGGFKETGKLITFMTCIEIEAPALLPAPFYDPSCNRLQPRHSHYLLRMPFLQKTLNYLEKWGHKYGLEEPEFNFQIPTYFTGGITVKYKGSVISIEVVDDFLRLRNSPLLNSKLTLKLRLLKLQGVQFYVVNPFENPNPLQDYEDYLHEKLKAWFIP